MRQHTPWTAAQLDILAKAGVTPRTAKDILNTKYESKPCIVDGYIPRRVVSLITGEAGVGKSIVAMDLAVAVAAGGRWLDRPCSEGPVLLIDLENDEEIDTQPRLRKLITARGVSEDIPIYTATMDRGLALISPQSQYILRMLIEHYQPRLVILDPLVSSLEGVDEYKAIEMRAAINILATIAKTYDLGACLNNQKQTHKRVNSDGLNVQKLARVSMAE